MLLLKRETRTQFFFSILPSRLMAEDDDSARIRVTHMPPPPPERPVDALKRSNTAPTLRARLGQMGLETRGTKSDLALRLAHHEAFVDSVDVGRCFTKPELERRLSASKNAASKSALCTAYLERLSIHS